MLSLVRPVEVRDSPGITLAEKADMFFLELEHTSSLTLNMFS